MIVPVTYHSLESVLNILRNEQFKDNIDVKNLLDMYNNVLETEKNKVSRENRKKHPFIVIEGLDASGKTTVTSELAAKIKANTCDKLKQHFFQLREAFDNNALLRTAFYGLLNYITEIEIANSLNEMPVVLDRYWYSTTAYSIARRVNNTSNEYEVPSFGDEIYTWPSDLLQPDIILFLSVRESVRRRRYSARNTSTDEELLLKQDAQFRKNVLTVYRNMKNPPLEYIDANLPKDYVLNEVFDKIKHLLINSEIV